MKKTLTILIATATLIVLNITLSARKDQSAYERLKLFLAGKQAEKEIVITRQEDIEATNKLTKELFEEIAKPLDPKNGERLDPDRISELIKKGAAINAYNKNGDTPLIISLTRPRKDVATSLLLDNNVDVQKPNKSGATPLMRAAQKEYLEYKPNDTDFVKELLERGADVEARDSAQKTAFLYAAQAFNIEAMRQLLEAGADVNAKDTEHNNALNKIATWYLNQKEEFVKQGREAEFYKLTYDMVQLLIDYGIKINNRDSSGATPLMFFAAADAAGPVEVLLNAGARTNMKDKRGETVWDYVKPGSHSLKLLKAHGSQPRRKPWYKYLIN